MLRYRVAYDSHRGHFVLPALPSLIPFEETFASRLAAQKIAQARNAQADMAANDLPKHVTRISPRQQSDRRHA